VAALTACSVSIPGTPSPTPGATRPATRPEPSTAPSSPPATADQPAPARTPTAAEVGAPFDPCATITWADFPEQVRHPKKKPPKLMEVKPDSGFSTGCRFDNSLATIQTCSTPPCDESKPRGSWEFFMSHVVWRDGPLNELRNPDPDAQQITIGGRPGLLIKGQGPDGDPRCLVKFALERGAAGVSILDGRFGIDTCATVRELATVIAERSS
jgi:hypothetical protein